MRAKVAPAAAGEASMPCHMAMQDIDLPALARRRKAVEKARKGPDNQVYFQSVAEARFVMRKAFRIIEEQAKAQGIDPLLHQALVQIYGSPEAELSVSRLAERLDISPQFASGLIRTLAEQDLVLRRRDPDDHRVSHVAVTAKAVELLGRIDDRVRFHIDYFTAQLPPRQRESALSVLMAYMGFR